jgi:hypothetical protein
MGKRLQISSFRKDKHKGWRLDMKWTRIGLTVCALFSTVGCSSLTVVKELHNQRFTSDEQPVAHLSARIGGL